MRILHQRRYPPLQDMGLVAGPPIIDTAAMHHLPAKTGHAQQILYHDDQDIVAHHDNAKHATPNRITYQNCCPARGQGYIPAGRARITQHRCASPRYLCVGYIELRSYGSTRT
jgi:hypothetical protein